MVPGAWHPSPFSDKCSFPRHFSFLANMVELFAIQQRTWPSFTCPKLLWLWPPVFPRPLGFFMLEAVLVCQFEFCLEKREGEQQVHEEHTLALHARLFLYISCLLTK